MAGVSQRQASQPEIPVAFLDVRHAASDYDGGDSELRTRIAIHANDDFYLGRDSLELKETYGTVSKRHLKIHCILFEDGGQWSISPLVYAEDVSTNGTYLKRFQTPLEDLPDSRGIFMRSKTRITLLEENDELWFHQHGFLQYRVNKDLKDKDLPFRSTVKADLKVIGRRYHMNPRKIGEGGYGAVHIAVHRKTQRQLACKIVALDTIRQQKDISEERLTREFDILRDLDHPNIVRLEKVFHSHTNLYIFQELVSGGDLFSFMDKSRRSGIRSIEAAVIVQQIIRGIDYLHDRGIVHRDLKPDNILLTSAKIGSRVVITDFGQARHLPSPKQPSKIVSDRMNTVVGTIGFNAPEVYKWNPEINPGDGYSKAIDMWSIGCIASHLLSGYPIFNEGNDKDVENAIKSRSRECDLKVLDKDPVWQRVGRRAKDFIRRTLVLDEKVRMTAKEALNHEWFSNPSHADELEAVYQHAIRDWEPKRKVFKLIERIESSRPKMDLHASRFFGEPLPPDRGSFPILLVSGLSSKLPAIEEESDCPPASPFEPQQTTEDDESEIPLPPQSHKLTETEDFTPAKDRPPTHQSPSVLSHAQLINPKQCAHEDSSSTQDLDSPHEEVPDLSLGHMLAQLSNARQGSHMFYENSMPLSSTSAESYTFGPPNTGPESVSQEMTRLSLLEERNEVVMTKTNAVVEPSDDEVQETAETTSSRQRVNHVTLGKRQPSFDFDEGMDDIDFLEVAAAVDFRQVMLKRPRIS